MQQARTLIVGAEHRVRRHKHIKRIDISAGALSAVTFFIYDF